MVTVSQNMNIVYRLEDNLDCNKICKDIQNMVNKKIESGGLKDCVLTIGINNIVDSQTKQQTLYLTHKENDHGHDSRQNSF